MKKTIIKEIFVFGIAGVVAYLVDVSLTTLLEPYLGVYIARIPAFLAAATTTWVINRKITFRHRPSKYKNLLAEYGHYLSLMLVGAIVNYVAYAIAVTFIQGDFKVVISVAIGSLAGMGVNFITSRKYIYKESESENIRN